MVKKTLVCVISVSFLILGYAGISFSASTTGPETLTLKSSDSDKKPPVTFPHRKHQDAFECGECHHTIVDGKQAPYTEGMEIKNCETCHNSKVLAGRKKGKLDLDSFKGAGHGNCLECHKEKAKEDSSLKKLKSCKTCHAK